MTTNGCLGLTETQYLSLIATAFNLKVTFTEIKKWTLFDKRNLSSMKSKVPSVNGRVIGYLAPPKILVCLLL